MKQKSKIWKRTILYSSLMLIVYLIAVIYLIVQVALPKSKNEILLKTAKIHFTSREKLLKNLKSKFIKKGISKELLTEIFNPEERKSKKNLLLIKQISQLEKTPKSGQNERMILSQLKNKYKSLNNSLDYTPLYSILNKIHYKSIIVLTLFLLGIGLVIFILIKLIVSPLEKIITEVHKVAGGDLDVKFKAESSDEMGELAEVLGDLSANFKELLVLMKSTYKEGFELIDKLNGIKESKSVSMEEFSNLTEELNQIFTSINEITVFFTSFSSTGGKSI